MVSRNIKGLVNRILNEYGKIALVSGPRQVGKTTLARELLRDFGQGSYVNWDVVTDQRRIVREPYFFEREDRDPGMPSLMALDEIHKYARWKNYLKGAWDKYNDEFRFLVTGSGRLDLFRKGGESLTGRYLPVPLWPFSVGELTVGRVPSFQEFLESIHQVPAADPQAADVLDRLHRLSGFPEPFMRGEQAFYNVWFQERKTALVRQDIRDATRIREISLVEVLSHLIPERVGSPLSINSLREDLGVAFETARDWIDVLASFYYLFRVTPHSRSLARAIKKEAKVYLCDWVEVRGDGPRFENLVAMHLHKAVETWRATGETGVELKYLRDRQGREVDFVLTEHGVPAVAIECKFADTEPADALRYFQDRLAIPVAVQVVAGPGVCRRLRRNGGELWVVSADRWLALLP